MDLRWSYSIFLLLYTFCSSYYLQTNEIESIYPSRMSKAKLKLRSASDPSDEKPICDRLSKRRYSNFDDTWSKPYPFGQHLVQTLSQSMPKQSQMAAHILKNSPNPDPDTPTNTPTPHPPTEVEKEDVVFEFSDEEETSDGAMASAQSDDEVSLYADALSRKTSEKSIVIPMY